MILSSYQKQRCLFFLLTAMLLSCQVAIGQSSKKIRQDIKQHFIPIDGSSELLPPTFLDKLEGKRIVGLGEATHGTAEFEQMFSLLTRSLVMEQGFNVVVLAEANFYDTRALNDYVVHGKGDAETAIRYARHTPTTLIIDEEARKLAEWLRALNEDRALDNRVWMLGADVLSPSGGAYNALILCQELGISLPKESLQYLSELASLPPSMHGDYAKRIPLPDALSRIAPLFRAVRQQPVLSNLSFEQQWLLQSVATLEHAVSFLYDDKVRQEWSKRQYRDEAMLANIKWIMDRRPNARLVVYGHNAHMEKTTGYKFRSKFKYDLRLGGLLSDTYGKDYYAICTETQSGIYWAGDDDGILPIPKAKNKIGLTIGETVDAPLGLLDINATSGLTKYFSGPRKMTFGNIVGSNNYPLEVVKLSSAFDALLFVSESTPKVRAEPKAESKRFSLNLLLGPNLDTIIDNRGNLAVSLRSSHTTLGTSLSGEGVYLALMFLDSQTKLIDYRANWLSGVDTIEQVFIVPSETEKIWLGFVGSNVKDFQLEELSINGAEMDMQALEYYGQGYDKSLEVEKDKIRESNTLIIESTTVNSSR